MSLAIDIAGNQIDGARDYQEDAFLITHLGDRNSGETTALVIVADGMGGHAAGNVASNMAVQAFNKHFSQHYTERDTHQLLLECIDQANTAIADTIRETAALRGMGCTLVAAFFNKDQMWIASVGDSHLYLLRDNSLEKRNADHSYGGFLDRMAAAGKPVEAEEGFARNMLMSALTGEDIADIDCPDQPLDLEPGDRVFLASDGLDTLSHGKVVHFSKEHETAKSCCDALLEGVTKADMPRQDNTTVVIIDVLAETEQVDLTEPAAAPAKAKPAPYELEQTDDPENSSEHILNKPTPRPEPETPAADKASSGGKGGLIAAVVLILIAAGAGAWFFLGQPSSPPPVVITEPMEEELDDPIEEAEVMDEPETTELAESETETSEPEPTEATPPPPPVVSAADGFRDTLGSGGQGPLMLKLPGGTYLMGGQTHKHDFDERPQHKVTVPAFAISQYEITIADYEPFARAQGRKFDVPAYLDKDSHPMVNVTWEDAFYYARWLSEQTGQKYRLASEAEWEYAARGGTTSDYWWGFKMGQGNAHCGFCGSPFKPREAAPVGSFNANPFGLFDTAGNVHEWVEDCYHDSYENAPTDGSVWVGGNCEVRIIRGGSFDSAPDSLRSAKRDKLRADRRYNNVGFRVVREL